MTMKCDNCGKTVHNEAGLGRPLQDLPNLALRLDPGGVVPAGECSTCGGFVYPEPERPGEKRQGLRRVEVMLYEHQPRRPTVTFEALFHCWSMDYDEFDTGPGNFAAAVVEKDDGTVWLVPACNIRFLARDTEPSVELDPNDVTRFCCVCGEGPILPFSRQLLALARLDRTAETAGKLHKARVTLDWLVTRLEAAPELRESTVLEFSEAIELDTVAGEVYDQIKQLADYLTLPEDRRRPGS